MDNLLNKGGCKFKATIRGEKCEGVIYIEDNKRVYLLQDKMNGSEPDIFPRELGFKYSWAVAQGTPWDLERTNVEDLEIIEETPIIASSSNLNSKKKLLLFL